MGERRQHLPSTGVRSVLSPRVFRRTRNPGRSAPDLTVRYYRCPRLPVSVQFWVSVNDMCPFGCCVPFVSNVLLRMSPHYVFWFRPGIVILFVFVLFLQV